MGGKHRRIFGKYPAGLRKLNIDNFRSEIRKSGFRPLR